MIKKYIKKIIPLSIKKSIYNILLIARGKRSVKPFLVPGIYRISMQPRSKVKMPVGSIPVLIKFKNTHDGLASNTNTEVRKHLSFYFSNKTIAFTDDRVFSFYQNTEKDRNRLSRIEQYIDSLIYPTSDFFEISIDDCYTITKQIGGVVCCDKTHFFFFARELLKYASEFQNIKRPEEYDYLDNDEFKNIRYHVQHGDLHSYNVLWQDDIHYCLIDFDEIGIFPTFYDFFYFILASEKWGLEEYLDVYFDQEISDYMAEKGIHVSIEKFKDECLAAFVLVPNKFITGVEIIRRSIPDNYLKTREALDIVERNKSK